MRKGSLGAAGVQAKILNDPYFSHASEDGVPEHFPLNDFLERSV